MNLTKKEQAEVSKVYDLWLNSYLNGDVQTYDSYLDDRYRFIGSTNNEDFLNRKDTTIFFEQTADQLAGNIEIRNSKRTFEKFDELIFITHLFDAYFLHGNDWEYYGKFRFTSTLKKNTNGWRFIYQHFSTPDSKAQEGETIGTEQIAAENLMLREAVQRRTIELEQKSRELEIEAALERVRARAMAMQKSDELKELIGTVFTELTNLDLELTRCHIMIFDPKSNSSTWWMVNSETPSEPTGLFVKHHDQAPFLAYVDAWKKRKKKWQYTLEGKVKKDWDNVLFSETELSQLPEVVIAGMKAPDRVYLHASFNNFGNLSLASLELLSNEHLDIMLRFAKVFDLTYTRFNDLQKAEAQARESEIELALERVRARTMAMQRSDELADASFLLDSQIRALGIKTRGCAFNIYGDNESTEWFSSALGTMPVYKTPRENIFLRYYEEGQTGKSMYINLFEGEACAAHYDYLCTLPVMGEALKKLKESGGSFPTQQIDHATYFKYGYLLFITLEPVPQEHDIFIRFAKVFEQTYTRFLDLQKAEAQAREAQIEAALERTRSKSMLMQHSDEIKNISNIFHEQLLALDIPSEFSYVWLPDETKDEHQFWATWADTVQGKTVFKCKTVNYPLDKTEPYTATCFAAWKSNQAFHESKIRPAEVEKFFNTWEELLNGAEKLKKEFFPEGLYYTEAYMKYGCFGINIRRQLSEAEKKILIRFTKEFERTYTRFLDLKKAEAQAREAQIEAALERVRSQSLAMHKTDELQEVVTVLVEKLQDLGVIVDAGGVIICTYFKDSKDVMQWIASPDFSYSGSYLVPYFDHPVFNDAWNSRESGVDYFSKSFSIAEKNSFFEYAFEHSDYKNFPDDYKSWVFAQEQHSLSFAWSINSAILIPSFTGILPNESDKEILKRFARVFEQAYVRFMDMQKAEAQAREAQIEAALEKVRSRTIGMQRSDELQDAAALMFQQIESLDINIMGCGFNIWDEDKKEATAWMSGMDRIQPPFKTSSSKDNFIRIYEAAQKGESLFVEEQGGKELEAHYKYMASIPVFMKILENLAGRGGSAPSFQITHCAFFSQGYLMFITLEPATEAHDIFKRFAKVFEQTYTRFLDLQKAEAQAREAQIENALEKVRSRTMAMQKSEELPEAANNLFLQVQALGIPAWSAGYCIWENKDKTAASCNMSTEGEIQKSFILPTIGEGYNFYDPIQKGETFYVEELGGNAIIKHYDFMRTLPTMGEILDELIEAGLSLPTFQIFHIVYFPQGYLMFITYEKVPKAHDIFNRFAKVFEQTYTRFLDLKKAETQALEAQIETALERVRSRSLAMHQSNELQEVISVVFQQMQNLGIKADASLINILTEDSKDFYLWIGTLGQNYAQKIKIPYIKHPIFDVFYEARDQGKSFMTNILTRAEKDRFFEYAFEYSDLKLMPVDRKKYVMDSAGFARSFAWSKNSGITVQNYAGIPYSDHENEILKRFAQVFEQAYTRFLDVIKAETQAREAVKQATLERVRGEIASMRTTEDLKNITPLIWKELNTLGVPFIRCGVFIINENSRMIQTFLSTPNGDSLSAFEMPFENKEIATGLLKHWKLDEIYYEKWDKKQFVSFMQNLITTGQIENPESFKGESAPPELLYLNFVPFKQGMLYVGNIAPIKQEELELVQALAKTFSVAYARYEDFRQLEEAKDKIEHTLIELKSTQSQLIQAEKMASLGELTAGIAHEIQNPLNFVNNFSEINKEMLEEMNEEIENGNLDEVKEIAKDVIENEQKINHHGKRASVIVKGMLEHSRTSDSKKQLTNINILADEYLRLAYHGLRAKDKSFNADFKTEFDESLPKINVIPQDIGRVLLNLINNAFYAVDKMVKSTDPLAPKGGTEESLIKYKPEVIVSTSSLPPSGGTRGVKISVKDNGSGIPPEIKDKIFQPFFTTKPTGSGTGLGLSLSYDIIKAHGGEITVESTENKSLPGEQTGTKFIITLPVTT